MWNIIERNLESSKFNQYRHDHVNLLRVRRFSMLMALLRLSKYPMILTFVSRLNYFFRFGTNISVTNRRGQFVVGVKLLQIVGTLCFLGFPVPKQKSCNPFWPHANILKLRKDVSRTVSMAVQYQTLPILCLSFFPFQPPTQSVNQHKACVTNLDRLLVVTTEKQHNWTEINSALRP